MFPNWEHGIVADVNVIGRSRLEAFWKEHRDAEQALRAWFQEVEEAEWKTTSEIKARHPRASILKGGRVVFDIRGNRYRLVVQCAYPNAYVRWIGTHAEYDRIDAQTI